MHSALSTRSNGHSALSATHLIGTECSVRADRRDDELPFIPGQAPAAEGGVAVKVPQTPSIKTVFTLTRIKRENTKRTSTVLFVTLNKKTHTVSALELHCALSTEYSESGECTQNSVHNKS